MSFGHWVGDLDPDPRAGLHNRCHQREAVLVRLLREARDLIDEQLFSVHAADLGRRIDAATDNAREG